MINTIQSEREPELDNFTDNTINSKNGDVFSDRINYNPQVALYPNITEKDMSLNVSVSEVFLLIKNTKDYHSINEKNKLPVAYFSVSSFNGNKEYENIVSHTGLIIIDVDLKDNQNINFEIIKSDLILDEYIYGLFNSPSGGVKLIIKTVLNNIDEHLAYYHSIVDYITEKYHLIIDMTGSNPNRACYIPNDNNCYTNQQSRLYQLTQTQINLYNNSTKVIQSKSKGKKVYNIGNDYTIISDDVHLSNLKCLLEKRTQVGLSEYIFNNIRYKDIEKRIMGIHVPFFELLIYRESHIIEGTTRIDEQYFNGNILQTLDIRSIKGFEDGICYCNYYFKNESIIEEGYRGKTLYNIAIKIIFNNPFIHPLFLYNELYRINDLFCENPNPNDNPKPDEYELKNIVNDVYQKYLDGSLNFDKVMKKGKFGFLKKKFIFHSKRNPQDKYVKQKNAIQAYWKPYKESWMKKYAEAITVLQDGCRITQKRIAKHMGVSIRTIRRHDTSSYDDMIKSYNSNRNLIKFDCTQSHPEEESNTVESDLIPCRKEASKSLASLL